MEDFKLIVRAAKTSEKRGFASVEVDGESATNVINSLVEIADYHPTVKKLFLQSYWAYNMAGFKIKQSDCLNDLDEVKVSFINKGEKFGLTIDGGQPNAILLIASMMDRYKFLHKLVSYVANVDKMAENLSAIDDIIKEFNQEQGTN